MNREMRSIAAIAKRLRATREALELKQREFAGLAGIAANTYNQWEKGERRPGLDQAIRLADAHRITLDWIYLGDMSGLPLKISVKLPSVMARLLTKG